MSGLLLKACLQTCQTVKMGLFCEKKLVVALFSKTNLLQMCLTQKQPPEVFYKKSVFKNFPNFTEKHLCWSLAFNKVAGLRPTDSNTGVKNIFFLQNTSDGCF